MNTRVKQLREILNISQNSFGKRLGVTGAGISKIESGSRNLTEQMLLMICKEFNINENWLRFGVGEIFKQKLPDAINQLVQSYHLDELDQRIIMEYIKLDDKKRSVIKEYIQKVAHVGNHQSLLQDGSSSTEVLKCAEDTKGYIKANDDRM